MSKKDSDRELKTPILLYLIKTKPYYIREKLLNLKEYSLLNETHPLFSCRSLALVLEKRQNRVVLENVYRSAN